MTTQAAQGIAIESAIVTPAKRKPARKASARKSAWAGMLPGRVDLAVAEGYGHISASLALLYREDKIATKAARLARK